MLAFCLLELITPGYQLAVQWPSTLELNECEQLPLFPLDETKADRALGLALIDN